MATIEFTATEDIWYITSPDNHYGELRAGDQFSSGQNSVEYYNTKEEWLAALGDVNQQLDATDLEV